MSDEVINQIEEMLKVYEGPEDSKVDDVEVVNDEVVDDVKDEPEVKPESEIEKLRREQLEIKTKLDEILNRPADKSKEPEPEVIPILEQNFLDGENIEDLVDNPDALNKLLNKVFVKALETSRKELESVKTNLLSTLPNTIKENVKTVDAIKEVVNKFYEENKDLQPFKGAVSVVLGELAAANPTWDYNKLLKKSEEETRIRLGISKKSSGTKPPNLPNRRSQLRVVPDTPETDPLVSQIEEMNKSILKWR